MLLERRNVLLNPGWLLQDYGVAAISSGHPATCWTMEWLSGTPGGVTALPVAAPASAPKFLRDQALQVNVVAASYDPTAVLTVRQKVENSDMHGQTTVRLSVWAAGPVGGSFVYGVGGRYLVATTTGPAQWNRYPIEQTFDDISTSLNAEVFRQPADLDGSYWLGYALLEYLPYALSQPVPELRTRPVERGLCLSRVRPVGRFARAYAKDATTIIVPVECMPRLRAAPVPVTIATSVDFKTDIGATVKTAASPTITLGTAGNGDRSVHGGVFTIGGFSGLTAGQNGWLATDTVALLEAELA